MAVPVLNGELINMGRGSAIGGRGQGRGGAQAHTRMGTVRVQLGRHASASWYWVTPSWASGKLSAVVALISPRVTLLTAEGRRLEEGDRCKLSRMSDMEPLPQPDTAFSVT